MKLKNQQNGLINQKTKKLVRYINIKEKTLKQARMKKTNEFWSDDFKKCLKKNSMKLYQIN